MIYMRPMHRRSVLRGMMGGAAISVGLPILDCFLNTNGTAFAATGQALPVRFGTWFWGCGLNPGRWEPDKIGADYDIKPEMEPVARFKNKLNIYSGLKTFLDGKAVGVHFSGVMACTTGTVPNGMMPSKASIDSLVADVIGTRSRFRSIEVACAGIPSHSQSRRSATAMNPAEVSPAKLYTKIFGPEFTDPNAAEFKPDPAVMVRKSALSVVAEKRQDLMKKIGAADRQRLDEYFTSVRELEQQLALQLEKPAPIESCSVPGAVADSAIGNEIAMVRENNRLFSTLLAHAVACDQTRVVNVAFADATSSLRHKGGTQSHHEHTHEEPIDVKLGYQPELAVFNTEIMEGFSEFLTAMDGIKEGDSTLLDRSIIFASTDHGYAKLHGLENMPLFTAGSGGGRMKTGIHVAAKGQPVTRVGLTAQQAMGVPVSSWGTESNETSRTITEVMA
jgi:hypothetical protein